MQQNGSQAVGVMLQIDGWSICLVLPCGCSWKHQSDSSRASGLFCWGLTSVAALFPLTINGPAQAVGRQCLNASGDSWEAEAVRFGRHLS